MLVNKITKTIQTRADMPNTNWIGSEWYLVTDYSPLATKIKRLFPRFKFITDDNGVLVDVEEIPKTQEELNKERIAEIDTELISIDSQGVNRHLENQIEASGTYDTIYESTRKLIDRKNELREERKSLIGGVTNAKDNINE